MRSPARANDLTNRRQSTHAECGRRIVICLAVIRVARCESLSSRSRASGENCAGHERGWHEACRARTAKVCVPTQAIASRAKNRRPRKQRHVVAEKLCQGCPEANDCGNGNAGLLPEVRIARF